MTEKPTINNFVSLLGNEKNNFYKNLDTKVVIDYRTFWKTVKPLLSKKVTKHCYINLVDDDKIISRNGQILEKFNENFISIPFLNMPNNGYNVHIVLTIIGKYKDNPSIKLIKAKSNSQVFKFCQINIKEIKKTFQNLDPKKSHKRMILKRIY